ncbi:DUF7504 family protein [Halobellus captivus]|uniref:DUF7504 family protein n=1 Tax=Halobellus captivus TaxID=2592614 RepID=UPI0011A8AA34|nr:hypothetical protein [Halobellus captivus]
MTHDEEDSSSTDDASSSSLGELADQLDDTNQLSDASGDWRSLSELVNSIEQRRGDAEPTADLDDRDLGRWDFVAREESGEGDSAVDPKTEALLELTGGASNILLSGPGDCPAEQNFCSRLMEPRVDDPVNLLVVTISDTPSQRLSVLENYLESPVNDTVVVDVRTYNRESSYEEYDGPVDIHTVSNAQDLRRLGIVISKVLTEWEDLSDPITMCVHSLSDLLELNEDHQRVFRFLHVLRGRVQSADVRAHYHFDPERHDDQAVRTFSSLFDTVIQFDENGSIALG